MTALYEQWQAARQQRQDEVLDRRDQVDADLERWQSDRLAHAVQLRQDLAQMVADLQTETQLWLRQTADQRRAKIPPMQQALQQYAQALQIETQAKLTDLHDQRHIAAADLRHRLQQDCQARQEAVGDLRLEMVQDLKQIRQRVQLLKQETVALQAGYRQEQAMMRSELMPKLADYVDNLQAEVQNSLAEVAELRQQAAIAHQAQRQQDRQALADSVDDLFVQLAAFRHHLQGQRQALTETVWGPGETAVSSPAPTAKPSNATRRPPQAKPTPPQAAVQPPAPAKSPTADKPVVAPKFKAVAQVAQPVPPAPAQPEPATVVSAPAKAKTPTLDEVVYNYLHLAHGARLSEIESELGINRFQAVDALRSLMEKDLIVKDNRTYHVQEEAVL